MTRRSALLIGSMPFDSEAEAMKIALGTLGDRLLALPDGEIGEKSEEHPDGHRQSWIHTALVGNIESGAYHVEETPELNERGFEVGRDARWKIRPSHAPRDLAAHMDFGYARFFRSSYPIFQQLRKEAGADAVPFEVGIPTGNAISLYALGPLRGLRYRKAHDERLAQEVAEIVEVGGDDVVVQVEVPFEMMMAGQLPRFAIGLPAGFVTSLIERFPTGTRVGLHLCCGDLNNEAVMRLNVERMLVDFSKALLERWPQGRKLEYVHFPLAEAATPPSLDRSIYEPLRDVVLPAGTRFVAGFVHERLSEAQNAELLRTIEDVRGGPVDIACSCGLGRRQPDVARELLRLMATMADLD